MARRVSLNLAQGTRSPRVFRTVRNDFALDEEGRVLATLAETKFNKRLQVSSRNRQIGVFFDDNNSLNTVIHASPLMQGFLTTKDMNMADIYASRVLNLSALHYIVEHCEYLGINAVNIITETFAASDFVDLLSDKAVGGYNRRGHDYYSVRRSAAPWYEMVNAIKSSHLDIKLTATGAMDKRAIAMMKYHTVGEKSVDESAQFAAECISSLSNGNSVSEVRDHIRQNTPVHWHNCIFADYNRKQIEAACLSHKLSDKSE